MLFVTLMSANNTLINKDNNTPIKIVMDIQDAEIDNMNIIAHNDVRVDDTLHVEFTNRNVIIQNFD